jgi:hypothetical protein
MTPPALFPKYLAGMPYFEEGRNFFVVEDLYVAVVSLL